MQLIIENVQYHPNRGSVAVLCTHALGSLFVNLHEDDLVKRSAGGNWGNEEVLAAVKEQIKKDKPDVPFNVVFAPFDETGQVEEPE